jgi:eukaryotic-like serine/threonine-protein kinase
VADMNVAKRAGAWRLLGSELPNGWRVVAPVGWDPDSGVSLDHYNGTGGAFSVPYIVEKGSKRAFLKAINLSKAMNSADIIGELHLISAAHTFETMILRMCEGASMDRVVVALDSGQIRVGDNLQDAAPYLIFELADGDVRRRTEGGRSVSSSMVVAGHASRRHRFGAATFEEDNASGPQAIKRP